MPDAPRTEYERRRRHALKEDARLDRWSALFGNGRVLLVGIALVAAVQAGLRDAPQRWPLHVALAVLFVALLVPQVVVDRRRRREQLRAAFYAQGLERLEGKPAPSASTGEALVDATHPYAYDLDVIGTGSVFQLVDTTRTRQGEATLGSWLLAPSPLDEVRTRRDSVTALEQELDARERLALPGFEEASARVEEGPIIEWGEAAKGFRLPLSFRLASFVLPPVTIAGLTALHYGEISPWPVALLLVAHAVVLKLTRPAVGLVAKLAEHTERELLRLLPLFEAAAALPKKTPALSRLDEEMSGAVEAVRSLRRRVTVFQSRANLFVVPMVFFLFWDLHAAAFLESWRRRHGASLRRWFAALGEAEALSALATHAYEHPDDVWPELVDGPLVFEAEALGHPLIAADKVVRNDVRVPGPGHVLLVTGSNMSGKSTLLRAVGLGAVMALAGMKVRARRLVVSRLQVATTMRVSDSLQEGASFFLAEVRRLHGVTQLAKEPLPVLFLLDEILQGTNTRERSIGARGVVAHLSRVGAAGLVSTHDLTLARLGDVLGDKVSYAHFTDQVEGDAMTFDYRMRPGVVQSSNALRLMRAVGLEVEVPADEDAPPNASPAR